MHRHRRLAPLASLGFAALLSGCSALGIGKTKLNAYGNPVRLTPRATSPAIDENDLRTRLYVFSDDSMMGRQYGREGNMKGTAYIARELERLGVAPGGDSGTYFQSLPSVQRRFTRASVLQAGGRALRWESDFVAVPAAAAPTPISGAMAIFGGTLGDTARQVTAQQAAGKFVVLLPPATLPAPGPAQGAAAAIPSRFTSAAAVAIVNLDATSPSARRMINEPAGSRPVFAPATGASAPTPATSAPLTLRITREAAAQMLGAPLESVSLGHPGTAVTATLVFEEHAVPLYARNIVGIIRGRDSSLARQYVTIGAHNDHIGFNTTPVDHDSARAFASAAYALQMASGDLKPLTDAERASIRVNVDSLRRIRSARRDSINNGADDDGSGSVAVLEIAEAIARAPVKPRRSILLVWHTGEEAGLTGSRYYLQHPTVPRDSIVALINIDMIGRGRRSDIIGGGGDYLAVVGSRMLSTELGQAVVAANLAQPRPLRLDYRFDQPTTWPGYTNIYGRSDHANYARCNIPIAFFFTGLHQDYHRVTDEAQYIDYPHFTMITRYIHDLMIDLANRPKRPVVDKPVAGCPK